MTIESTEATPTTTDSIRRSNYKAALEWAARLVDETTDLPNDVTITVQPWAPDAPEIRAYFHRDVPKLRQFRDDQMLTETMTTREDGSVYIEATGEADGVRLVAWSLTAPTAAAVAA